MLSYRVLVLSLVSLCAAAAQNVTDAGACESICGSVADTVEACPGGTLSGSVISSCLCDGFKTDSNVVACFACVEAGNSDGSWTADQSFKVSSGLSVGCKANYPDPGAGTAASIVESGSASSAAPATSTTSSPTSSSASSPSQSTMGGSGASSIQVGGIMAIVIVGAAALL